MIARWRYGWRRGSGELRLGISRFIRAVTIESIVVSLMGPSTAVKTI